MKAFKINNNITKYIIGSSVDQVTTNAINIEGDPIDEFKLLYFTIDKNKIIIKLNKSDAVYGLGATVRGINKRGWIYESFCTDDPIHTENKTSLNWAHNFILINGEKQFGIFIDHASKIKYDIAYTQNNTITITLDSNSFIIYVIEDTNTKNIVCSFRKLIGTSYIPPKWAFGYQQSRWGYKSLSEIQQVVEKFEKHQLPIDVINLDIDHMDNCKIFTTDPENFDNVDNIISELKQKNIKLLPIIDAAVKIDENYNIFNEGTENNYFCVDSDKNPYVAACWPGKVNLPDFVNPKVQEWFGRKLKFYTNKGIDGFWLDMNEPSIFYTPKELNKVIDLIIKLKDEDIDTDKFFAVKDSLYNLLSNPKYYSEFYNYDGKEYIRHNLVHNIYGMLMIQSVYKGLEKIDSNKRFLIFARSSCIGAHRYGGLWTGDNRSWWSHLLLNIKMMPSLNMCGFLYTGADIGGFSDNATEDLVIRWTQFGIFTPLFRNHSAKGTRHQEPYEFENIQIFKEAITMRYALLKFIYSEYMKSALSNQMYFSPLSFDYSHDKYAKTVEDQLIIGNSIMIAPIYTQNSIGRYVYLPENMLFLSFTSWNKYKFEVKKLGHNYIDVDIDSIPIFVLPNKMLVLNQPALSTKKIDDTILFIICFIKDIAVYELYDDDGETKKSININNIDLRIEISKIDEQIDWNIEKSNSCKINKINITVFSDKGFIKQIKEEI